MKRSTSLLALGVVLTLCSGALAGTTVSDLEDLSLAPESYWNGADGSGGFTSRGLSYRNSYDATYYSWDGFAYSNITDDTTQGYSGQYNAITGAAHSGANYGVGYVGWAQAPTVVLGEREAVGMYATNNNYAYYSMLYGDSFAKQFGGASGDDPDWFKLTVEGIAFDGTSTGAVDFYLADYRFSDNSQDYLVDDWSWVDLSSLGSVYALEFSLSSSDVGDWGMNTPAYFALDDVTAVPVPGALLLGVLGCGVTFVIRRVRGA